MNNQPWYIVVSGLGRSGTTWLLELLDLSAKTFCRNEPYASDKSLLSELEYYRFVKRDSITELDKSWDSAVSDVLGHMGFRDPAIVLPKDDMYDFAKRFGIYRVIRGPKYRFLLSRLLTNLRGEQWPVPPYVYDLGKRNQTTGVVKLTRSPGWTSFVLKHRPGVPVLHIVRHPGGFLNSWANRYLSTTTTSSSARQKRIQLIDICASSSEWREILGNVDEMGLEELHLWYWLYMNQVVIESGRNNPDFHLIQYEDLVSRQTEIMKPIFERYGLKWTEEIAGEIARKGKESKDISLAWKRNLTEPQIELCEKFLELSKDFSP